MKKEESRRLFFALWPDNTVRAALQEQAKIMRADTDGRAVAESNLHVTLAFLGKVPLDLVSTVCTEAGCIRSGSFDLAIDQTGWWKKTGILWLAPSALPAGLNGLVHSLWDRLHPLGFKADFHKFRPHVTIARKCSHSASAALEPISWAIKNFALLESETHPKGARYRVLDQWSLNPGDDAGKGGCPDGRIVE